MKPIEKRTILEVCDFLDTLELKLGLLRNVVKNPANFEAEKIVPLIEAMRVKAIELRVKLHD